MDEYNGNYYSIFLTYYKVGEDNNKILQNEQYEIYSIDDVPTGITISQNENGRFLIYETNYNSNTINFIEKVTPNAVKDMLNSINNISDVRDLAANNDLNIQEWNSIQQIHIGFNIPIKLKQIKSANGYEKKDIIIQGGLGADFRYNASTNEITNKEVNFIAQRIKGVYSESNDFNNLNSFERIKNLQYISFSDNNYSCINSNAGLIITDHNRCTEEDYAFSESYDIVPYFLSNRGVVKLEITNTVNDLVKYNASNNNNLEYKIEVTNTGNILSSNNVITTNVPPKVVVDENSISDFGTYNKNSNTITWTKDTIEANEKVVFTYKAVAPSTASGEELIGNSSVVSEQVSNRVYSNNTIVTLDKIVEIINNPNTGTSMIYIPNTNIGMPISILFIILIIMSITGIIIKNKIKKKNTL